MTESNDKNVIQPVSKLELAANLASVVSSMAPWIGGPVSAVLGGFATDLKIKRVTEFIKNVHDRVDALHSTAAEEFVKSEDFADIFEKTAQRVADERDENKRKLFANYLLTNINNPTFEYSMRLGYLRLLDQIDMRHIALLKALRQEPTAEEMEMEIGSIMETLERRLPLLRMESEAIIHDTDRLGLTKLKETSSGSLRTMMTGDGAARLNCRITEQGKMLLQFICE